LLIPSQSVGQWRPQAAAPEDMADRGWREPDILGDQPAGAASTTGPEAFPYPATGAGQGILLVRI